MDTKGQLSYWRRRVFISVWITYGTFYLCRVNMSIAIPGIMEQFGYSRTALGAVMSSLFFAYAFGQFVNGQLGDKFGARKMISFGLVISGLLNIFFNFTTGLAAMMIIWGLNGYFQSMGWAPTVKTIANWFPLEKRGKMGGLLGTSYQLGSAYSWLLVGFLVGRLSWRWAFVIPGIIVIISAIHWYIRGRNAPEEVGLPTIEEESRGINDKAEWREDHHIGFSHTLGVVLKNHKIWLVGFGLFCLNIVRYGFIGWAPTYMFEVQKAAISTAAYRAIAIPIAGCFGSILAGIISDKLFKSRRAPIAAIMLLLLGLSAWLFTRIPAENWLLSFICLIFVGFLTYGPHVLMVGTIAMDFGTRKAASSAAGFIDCLGYIGASLTGVGSGWLTDRYGWNAAFYFWIAGAIIAAILMSLLWNYKPEKGAYH